MAEKRKAAGGLAPEDAAEDKKAKSEMTALAGGGAAADAEEEKAAAKFDNIEEDDEFQEFEVYTWDTSKMQSADSLDFQDNWDEDANDKDFIAQLRKELGK